METTEAVALYISAKTQRVSRRTIQEQRYRLGRFARTFHELPEYAEPIDHFLSSIEAEPETVWTYYRDLRTLYRFLARRGWVRRNPMEVVEPPRRTRKIQPALTRRELEALLAHPGLRPVERAAIMVMADTGMRIGGVLSITRGRIGDGYVIIDTNGGQRLVPLSSPTVALLQRTMAWPWGSAQAAANAVRKAMRRAGLPPGKARTKALRHTFARLWEGDWDALVHIGGWTTERMLLQVYRPYDFSRVKQEHARHSPVAALAEGRQLPLW